ncbi:MAG: hypothetical protein Q8O48_07425 [Anaerolineales bacterium]|nr:hypothetical protein [Anaerolineales bacterium]
MSKYASSVVKRSKPKYDGPHVIWRGIGCLMMLLIPAISIAAGIETIKYGFDNGWTIPYQLLGYPTLPDLFYQSSGLRMIFGPITRVNHLYAYTAASILYMITIGGTISLLYGVAYRIVGPSRYGPMDEPPPKIKTKKYTR